jgi:molybdenum cofactor cytidylyltransferase
MASNVFAIVLAAGSASRFGSTKQLVELEGLSLVARAVKTANEVVADRTVVVVGHDAGAVARELQSTEGFVIVNDRYAEGLGTSLSRAVTTIRHVASAVVVLLADQPGINSKHLQDLISAWNGDEHQIVATAFSETQGPPVLFPAACFDDLQGLKGDAGGKHLFSDSRFQLTTIAFEPAALDVDTPADLTQISRNARS